MDQATKAKLTPRFVDGKAMTFAGLSEHITSDWSRIDALWWRFAPHIGSVPGQVGARVAYGVVTHAGGGIDYLAAVEVTETTRLPKDFVHTSVPAQRYAVFAHDDHVSKLKETMDAIWASWPNSRLTHAQTAGAPAFFERYGEEYDPPKGVGGIEVWVPVK